MKLFNLQLILLLQKIQIIDHTKIENEIVLIIFLLIYHFN